MFAVKYAKTFLEWNTQFHLLLSEVSHVSAGSCNRLLTLAGARSRKMVKVAIHDIYRIKEEKHKKQPISLSN